MQYLDRKAISLLSYQECCSGNIVLSVLGVVFYIRYGELLGVVHSNIPLLWKLPKPVQDHPVPLGVSAFAISPSKFYLVIYPAVKMKSVYFAVLSEDLREYTSSCAMVRQLFKPRVVKQLLSYLFKFS